NTPVAHRGQLVARKVGHLLAGEPVRTGRRAIQAPQQVHQGGFAGPRWSHDRHELPGADAQGDAPKRVDRAIPLTVDFGEIPRLDDRVRLRRVLHHAPAGARAAARPTAPRPPPAANADVRSAPPHAAPRACSMMTGSPAWRFPPAISRLTPSENPMTTGTGRGFPLR